MWIFFSKIRKLEAEIVQLQHEKALLKLQIIHEKRMKENAIAAKNRLLSENYRLIGKIFINDAQKN
jgi:hypothetical protein